MSKSLHNSDQPLYALLSQVSGVPADKIKPEMPLFGRGLGLDSLSGTVLMTALERQYGITLDDIDLHMEALDSVGNLQELIAQSSGGAPGWHRLLEQVAAAARLQEGRGGVERVLACISAQPGLTSRSLAGECSLPTPTVSALRKELAKAAIIAEDGAGARLTDLGSQVVKGLALDQIPAEHGEGAYGRMRRHPWFPVLVEKLSALFLLRPTADTTLDQAKCLPETAAARALLALEYGVVAGRRIACVGDDDYTSIAVAALGQLLSEHGAVTPEQITVLDLDERILAGIADIAAERGYPVKTVRHDMRQPIPAELAGTHHGFFTDPPYTIPGAQLFLSRGGELCQPNGFHAFFSFASKGPAEMLAVQRQMVEMGLLIREVLPGFNRYEGASLWGNQSQMIICEGTGMLRSMAQEYSGPLYTADLRKRANRP